MEEVHVLETVNTNIEKKPSQTNHQHRRQGEKRKGKVITHTQSEPVETIITIIHFRNLLIFLGFITSPSSHVTVNSSTTSSSDPEPTLSSLPLKLIPSFKDQDRSRDRDVLARESLLDLCFDKCIWSSRGRGAVIGANPMSSEFEVRSCWCWYSCWFWFWFWCWSSWIVLDDDRFLSRHGEAIIFRLEGSTWFSLVLHYVVEGTLKSPDDRLGLMFGKSSGLRASQIPRLWQRYIQTVFQLNIFWRVVNHARLSL